ncbi:DUF502 domain-containing protein [Halobacterium sp. KA-6]|uniref:DUF502 domain-containing protein n=1 Tax=Halobacterium sp. KA-6 TaxID=2896368 RepID=UPI001E2E1EF7|nr:DUF502 domain-containing protein [Halobacterium sp. KA-6]MCD2204205.1 DUF502 domain-containing protein [Halobacterium sp. KA-6]
MLGGSRPDGEAMQRASESAYDRVREAALTGVTVVVPLLVTLYVLSIAVGVVDDLLEPLAQVLNSTNVAPNASEMIVDLVGVLVVVAITVLVGFAASFRSGERVLAYFDAALERIPGVGAVYKSFRQMGDVMVDGEADNFQSVKLVEFPHQDAYTLGFLTTETPSAIEDAAGHEEMLTLFLPLAPNPVMGGHLTHVPAERVMDVDMSVEEGMRAVVTMGVAVSSEAGATEGLSRERLERLTGEEIAPTQVAEDDE